MKIPSSRFPKVKIAIGYSSLLVVLLSSLVFIHQEVEKLTTSNEQQNLQTDSLLQLLHEKDRNAIQLFRVLGDTNDGQLSVGDLEEAISIQDSVVARQYVQHKILTKRDSLITNTEKKGFFKRLAEVFVPSKKDTAILVTMSREFATDTLIDAYNPVDSIRQRVRQLNQQKRVHKTKQFHQKNLDFHRKNDLLTARIDSLVQNYELNEVQRSKEELENIQHTRQRSTRMISGIAIGAVSLSVFFLILIWRDITRSNRYRCQLEEANQRAEELLIAREKMMLTITHDFKAPLSSIMGYTELLARLTEDERQRFYLTNMKHSSQHLLKLVSDLLDFHRLDLKKAEIHRITFNPSNLFEEIYISFQPLASTNAILFTCRKAPELDGYFVSDPLRIRQIVNNLLSNAMKFTAKGEVNLTVTYQSSKLCIEIADTGKGMVESDKERIFQEFTRLPAAQGKEGVGLGLSIVRKLVRLLEGDIEVQSTLGKGSVFKVLLPLYPVGGTVDKQDVIEHPVLPESSSKHILLIDDDKIQLTLTAGMLQQQGIQATCCERVDELFEQLRIHLFDALLTDVQMPAINGFDLLKLMRESYVSQATTIPVIAVTARSDMPEELFLQHGFAGYLPKPFTVSELLSKIEIGSASLSSAPKEIAPCDAFNFDALFVYSDNDSEAERTILMTFAVETEKNILRLEAALAEENVKDMIGVAHKLLPLLTMIGATEVLPLLTWLEVRTEKGTTVEINQKVEQAISLLYQVIRAAKSSLENHS